LRHVVHGAEHPHRLAVVAELDEPAIADRDPATLAVAEAIFDVERRALPHARLELALDPLPILGVEMAAPLIETGGEFAIGNPQHLLHAAAAPHPSLHDVPLVDHLAGQRDHGLVALLPLAQLAERALQIAPVLRHAHHRIELRTALDVD